MYSTRYNIYGTNKESNDLLIDCSFDNKPVAVDCLVHYINFIAIKHGIKILKDSDIRNILDANGKYVVGTYTFWIEDEEI